MMRSGPESRDHRSIREEEEDGDEEEGKPCPVSPNTIVLDSQNRIYLQNMSDPNSTDPSSATRSRSKPASLSSNTKRKMDYLSVNMAPRIKELSFDIMGPSKDSPFPWQRNIAVQVDIEEGEDMQRARSQRSCSESAVRGILAPAVRPKCMRKGLSLDSGNTFHKSCTLPQRVRSLREEEGVPQGIPPPRPTEGLPSPPERKRRTALTEGTLSMQDLLALANSSGKPKSQRHLARRSTSLGSPPGTPQSQKRNPLKPPATPAPHHPDYLTLDDIVGGPMSVLGFDGLAGLGGAAQGGSGRQEGRHQLERSDTLPSPPLSPVPWTWAVRTQAETISQLCRPHLMVTSYDEENEQERPLLPKKRILVRTGSGGLEESDNEGTSSTAPTAAVSRRGRRPAITGFGVDNDLSPSNSCDESDPSNGFNDRTPGNTDGSGTTTASNGTSGGMGGPKKMSADDSSVPYTIGGEKASTPTASPAPKPLRKIPPPLMKRVTVHDFTNTKSYMNLLEQDSKKPKSSLSILKLVTGTKNPKKAKEASLQDVLKTLKPTEFKDQNLSSYKDLHWKELIASKDQRPDQNTPGDVGPAGVGGPGMDGPGQEAEDIPFLTEREKKRREVVWELFQSECVFLSDHLMVLKHCFMEPIKKVQVEGHLMSVEPDELFGNLDELCSVSYKFCKEFISVLVKDAGATEFGRTEVLIKAMKMLSDLTKDGEVYHDYCLNYSKAVTYLEQLRKTNEDFVEFEKWCEQDPRCNRLQLTDLLISPMQHCTKVPLLLNNIRKYTGDQQERQQLAESQEKLETSLKNLEAKMKWLKNYERVQELQQQIIWQPITELDPRAFIPEFLKNTLNRQPCQRLLASPKRQLLFEGPLTLLEISKTVDMYMFLFDDILLLTRVKKPPRKKQSIPDLSNVMSHKVNTEGAVFVVHRQPIALDRFTIHDVRPPDASANGLKNAFVLVQISRFQQIIGVYTLQAPSEVAKTSWMSQLKQAQERYKAAVRKAQYSGHNLPHNDSIIVNSDSIEAEDLNKPLSQFVECASRNNSLHLLNPFRSSTADFDSVSMTSQMSGFSNTDTICTMVSDSSPGGSGGGTQRGSSGSFSSSPGGGGVGISQHSPSGSPPKSTSPSSLFDDCGGVYMGPTVSVSQQINGGGGGGGRGSFTSAGTTGESSTSPLSCGSPSSPLLFPRDTSSSTSEDMSVTSGGLTAGQTPYQHLSPPRSPYNSARGQRWKLKAIHEKSLSRDTIPLSAITGTIVGGGEGSIPEATSSTSPTSTSAYTEATDV